MSLLHSFLSGKGGGKSYPELTYSDYSASGLPLLSHNFAPSYGGGQWGYNSGTADMIQVTGNVDWRLFAVGGGGLDSGSVTTNLKIFESSSGELLYEEAGTRSTGNFHTAEFNNVVPVLKEGVAYQIEIAIISGSGMGSGHAYNKVSGSTVGEKNGVVITMSNPLTSFDGYGNNGTSSTGGQLFWLYAASVDVFNGG